jgi:hypothetical protein
MILEKLALETIKQCENGNSVSLYNINIFKKIIYDNTKCTLEKTDGMGQSRMNNPETRATLDTQDTK